MSDTPASPRVKLRSVSRRVPRARNAAAEVDESPEPTMRLSRAILVMLLLHVVAVGGFLASSVLKERDLKRTSAEPNAAVEAEEAPVPARGNSLPRTPATESVRPGIHVVRPGETLTLIAHEKGVTLEALVAANGASTVTNGLQTGQELRLPDRSPDPSTATESVVAAPNQVEARPKSLPPRPAATPVPASAKPKPTIPDSGKTYTVAKGEALYNIAQKQKVSYDSLMKLNGIDDPKKIRPGQKLRLPATPLAPKSKPKQT